LIIEDNQDAAASLRMLLEVYGHEAAMAHTGQAGVEEAQQFRPDVVLCDLGLPDMNGFAVARALRKAPATARAKLIALSGYGSEADQQKGREAGFDLHLIKPVDLEELRRVLGGQPTPE
jgi:DNA-binding response OmpR family regulator